MKRNKFYIKEWTCSWALWNVTPVKWEPSFQESSLKVFLPVYRVVAVHPKSILWSTVSAEESGRLYGSLFEDRASKIFFEDYFSRVVVWRSVFQRTGPNRSKGRSYPLDWPGLPQNFRSGDRYDVSYMFTVDPLILCRHQLRICSIWCARDYPLLQPQSLTRMTFDPNHNMDCDPTPCSYVVFYASGGVSWTLTFAPNCRAKKVPLSRVIHVHRARCSDGATS